MANPLDEFAATNPLDAFAAQAGTNPLDAFAATSTPAFPSTEESSFFSSLMSALGTGVRALDVPRQTVLGIAHGEENPMGRALYQVGDPAHTLTGQDVVEKQLPDLINASPAAATAVGTLLEFADPLALIGVGAKKPLGADKVDDIARAGQVRYPKAAGPTPSAAAEVGVAADAATDDALKRAFFGMDAPPPEALAAREEAVAKRASNLKTRIGEMFGERRERLTPEWVKKTFVENYGLPEAYLDSRRTMVSKIGLGMDEAQAAFTDLTKTTDFTTRRSVHQFMTGNLEEAELRAIPGLTDAMVDRAKGIRAMVDRNSEELIALSLPDQTKETIAANLGKYLPRVYRQFTGKEFRPTDDVIERARQYLLAEGTTTAGKPLQESQITRILDDLMQKGSTDGFSVGRVSPTRINRGLLMQRKDIPEPLQDLLGVFKESGVPEAKALAQQRNYIEKHKFFENVAASPEWTLSAKRVDDLKAANPEFLGKAEVVVDGVRYKQMPEGAGLGRLSGKYVQEHIHDDLTEMQRSLDWWQKAGRRMVNEFKVHKTVLSAKTHFRNMVGNAVMMNLSGTPLPKVASLLTRSAQESIAGQKLYQQVLRGADATQFVGQPGYHYLQAKMNGLFGTTFAGSEINAIAQQWQTIEKTAGKAPVLEKIWRLYDGVKRKGGELYQAEETWFKLAKYLEGLDKGMDAKAAVLESEKWLFNYGEVSKAVQAMRSNPIFGSPFITFTAKAIPRVAEAAVKHPVAFWKYPILFGAASAAAADSLDLKPHEYASLLKQMPDYVKRGSFLLAPTRRPDGTVTFVDFTYTLPWGNFADMVDGLRGSAKDPVEAVRQFLGPGGMLLAAISSGRDPFTKGKIWHESDPGAVKLQKALDYTARAVLSPMTPEIPGITRGGYDWKRIADAAKGVASRPDREVESMGQAIATSIFGAKTFSISPEQARKDMLLKFKIEESEIASRLRSSARKGDQKDVELAREQLRVLAKEREDALKSVREADTNQFKNFYRDFTRTFGFGTGL